MTCLAYASNGDVITGDSNGNVFIWGRGYNAVTKVIRKVHDGPIFSICVLKDGSIITGGGRDSRIVKFDTLYRKTGLEAQLPDHLGSIRTVSQGKGSQLLVGTTKNSILTGNFDLNFQEIMVGHVGEVRHSINHVTQVTNSISRCPPWPPPRARTSSSRRAMTGCCTCGTSSPRPWSGATT